MNIALVNAPFVPLYIPSTGVGYICAAAHGAGHKVAVCDLNFQFADWLLERFPALEDVWDRAHPDHLGQMIFSELMFPGTVGRKAPALLNVCKTETGHDLAALTNEAKGLVGEWIDQHPFADCTVVGFTLMNHQLLASLYLMRRIRRIAPDAKIVAGGFYVSRPNALALLKQVEELDFCVIGEGEQTFVDLLGALAEDRDLADMPGLCRREAGRQPVAGPPRRNLSAAELDRLPVPDYTWVPPDVIERKRCSIPVLSIRGCYWGHCTFCSDFQFNKASRARDPKRIVAEMEEQSARLRSDEFYFSDLATNDSIERVEAICDGLIDSGRAYRFRMLFIPDNITLPLLRKMRKSGCYAVQYGIESLSDDLLQKMAKAQRLLDNARCIALTEQAGMQPISNLLRNMPSETLSDIVDTYDKIRNFPELFNGYVFGRSAVPFRLRSGSSIQVLVDRRGIRRTGRSISHHFWPDDWDEAIPDIEWTVDELWPDQVLRDRLWRKIERALEQNEFHRRNTIYRDDGLKLFLQKYDRIAARDVQFELIGPSRQVYHELSEIRTGDAIAESLGLPSQMVTAILDYLSAEKLVCTDGKRFFASIHPDVCVYRPEHSRESTVEQAAEAQYEDG